MWAGGLAATDAANTWYCSMELLLDPTAPVAWRTRMTYYHASGTTPDASPATLGVANNIAPFPFAGVQDYNPDPSPGTFIFPQDWVVSITKDYDNDRVRFSFPWGTQDYALSNALFTKDPSSLRPSAIFAYDAGQDNDVTRGYTIEFRNIRGTADGVPFVAAAMSAADPGTWDPTAEVLPVSSPGIPNADGQLASGYQMGYAYGPGDPASFSVYRTRPFVTGASPRGLDIARDRYDCLLWELSIPSAMPGTLMWRRTRNGGRLWEGGAVYEDLAKVWTSPSISFWADQVHAVWSDGAAIYESFSYTAGDTWTVPTTLPYTGTNPRHVTEWTSGLSLYFFFQGADLYVVRTSDHSHSFWDAAPLLVKAAIGAQQVDADWAFDGSIVLTYFSGGTWQQSRSWDMGVSWS